jgi:glycosyltransferase involved in cell wall biosynthesis
MLDSARDSFQAGGVFESQSCAAVIPCFNEAGRVAAVVRDVRAHVPLVIVADDGSTDDTAASASRAGAVVVRLAVNRGKGAALRAGMAEALRRGAEWAVTLDGDGQHSPGDLPAFFETVRATGARLVVGNRMGQAEQMPWLRRWANRWMSWQLSRVAGRPLPDTQCGYRLMHLPSWSALALHTERFEVESETLLAFVAANCRVEFVPIAVIGSQRKSRIRPVSDTIRWLRWWRQLRRQTNAYEPGSRRQFTAVEPAVVQVTTASPTER